MAQQLMTAAQVSAEYGIAVQTLANWRWQGIGPAYVKATSGRGGRVLYRRSSIESWLDEQTVQTGGSAA
ncbi:helix-turn-helix domain-containing protein [Streptomyces sp. HNM0663]|uniref:Helix-turn-helix domain-containing protein n=1 Tax=Streptomyces chengmaiensis TaxID=3040919 RepID=A0ABT6HRC3_9ACTN|nr:helix-turn-helix domain-containing protein [Streptomyces chengmaiensis]MDH2391260.1 helix-turn-helix domain-containing protein [Streptomyces chengmaiensis]